MANREHRTRSISAFSASIVVAVAMAMPFHAWAVGSTPVSVVNAADLAKAMGVQHPFQKAILCASRARQSCDGSFVVPNNQRLVIEYVSAKCFADTGAKLADLMIVTSADGTTEVRHQFALGDTSSSRVLIGQPVRLYAAPGSTVYALGFEEVTEGNDMGLSCGVSFSGQSIDVP
jgi:hypothetical protein